MVSRISDRPTTTKANGSSASPSLSDTSMPTAVKPVTERSTPYSSRKWSCCARISRTRSSVAADVGPPSGTTWMMPVSAVWFGVDSGTSATPGSSAISSPRSFMSATGSVLVTMEPVTISGPLKPSPKCSETRSYVTRAGSSLAITPASGSARRRSVAGKLSAPMATMTSTTVSAGTLVTSRTQPAKKRFGFVLRRGRDVRAAAGHLGLVAGRDGGSGCLGGSPPGLPRRLRPAAARPRTRAAPAAA